ncbi:MAG: tRNA (adenosine(37)-N6)-threonylcarbamoyltransferase complex dimerization subunit type 1 TsaB [Firmicutes bacterium]|nr:tRNA (adenosine(37)-N6)-threonylcarbamoyltransferase complex dimerization subunit type 1 TsaB [Bacillota bacterium]
MYILAIETTGPHCSAVLIDENGNVMEKSSGGTLNHLQNLLPMVKQLLDDCKLQIDDVAAVAVSCGPGSFTGIRIGVTTARALCQAVDKPAIAVPTLKSFVYHGNLAECGNSGAAAACTLDFGRIAVPIFDARRNQVYGGAYVMHRNFARTNGVCSEADFAVLGSGEIVEIVRGGAYMLDEFLELFAEAFAECADIDANGQFCGPDAAEVVFYGDGCEKYGDTVLEFCLMHGINASVCGETQKASSVARLALDMYNAGELLAYGQLLPDYMRKAEAERKLEEKMREDEGRKQVPEDGRTRK